MNPIKELDALGQSIWLDYIRRDLITTGKLKKMIEEEGLRGMTSNPAIFEKAIVESHDYDQAIQNLRKKGKNEKEIYDALTIEDVQAAADVFRPVYDQTDALDGYVSLEVSPHLAHDTKGTIDEARKLWKIVNRPNVFIKVPATKEGLPAIQQLISEGININVTLLFGLQRYREVAEAYIAGLETRASQGKSIKHVASVASFFLSRIDVMLDPILEKKDPTLKGEVAIASAKLAYQIFEDVFSEDLFKKLLGKGARVQRLLWASTGTKNPAYSDVKYIEPLIGPQTVNTVPVETYDAYLDHGHPKVRIHDDLDKAHLIFQKLPQLSINMDQITQKLEDEAVEKFIKPFDHLIETLKEKK
jgi:transaldolase